MTRRELLWRTQSPSPPRTPKLRIPWLSVAIGIVVAVPVLIVASVLFTSNGAVSLSLFGSPWLEIRLPQASGGGSFVNVDAWIGLPLLAFVLFRALVRPRARASLRRLIREIAR